MHVKHGQTLKTDVNITDLLVKNKIEKFQIAVLKHLLGVSRKTTNLATLSELGRYPLTIYIQHQAIKYYLRLPHINHERLLYETYLEQKQMYLKGEYSFNTYIINILNKLGMPYIYTDQMKHDEHVVQKKSAVTIRSILTRLTDIFSQNALEYIRNTK